MEIKIAGTEKIEELKIIDPKTGCNWAGDLINHSTDLSYDEDSDMVIMQQVDFDWWQDLIERYQAADDNLHEIRGRVDNPEDLDKYLEDMNIGGYELENYPEVLVDAVTAWTLEQTQKIKTP